MVGLGGVSPRRTPEKANQPHLGASVRLSEIFDSGVRLEASTFAPEARAAVEDLRAAGVDLVPLYGEGGLSDEAHNAFRFKRTYVSEERGIPFLTSADIINLRPRGGRFLSRTRTPKLEDLLIRTGDVLISCSGTIGNVALAGKAITGMALSQHAIRWRCDDPALAGYVTAFLRSQVGRLQLKRITYGSVVQHIEPDHLEHVLVPDLHPIRRTEIGEKMCRATELRDKANALFETASIRLHEALGLPSISDMMTDAAAAVPYATVKASELQGRLDGGFHRPLVHRVLERLTLLPVPTKPLKAPTFTAEIRPVTRFRKRTYVRSGGIPLLSSKQLFQLDPIDRKAIARGAHERDLKEITLREDMVLVTCSGTIGRVQIIPRYMDGWTASQDAIRVIAAPEANPGYLFAWLDSGYGQELITRHTYGSVVTHIDKEMLGSALVPALEQSAQEYIGSPVLEAKNFWDEAWSLEQEAIAEINQISSVPDDRV